MAEYPPPTDNYPIFDSLAFTVPLTASITQAEADTRYLARQGTASSIATTTGFSDNITIGNSLLDYIPTQGLQIRPTTNSEAVFLRILDGTGATKQKIECNETHTHLYDTVRFTESATVSNYTTLNQTGSVLEVYNTVSSGTINFRTETSGGVATTPLQLATDKVTVTPSQTATALNGLVINSALFGRDDTTANTFNGTLSYIRHPIGWTISFTKVIATIPNNSVINVITFGTANTELTTLSNGVWQLGVSFNNLAGLGAMTYLSSGWALTSGGTILNTGDFTIAGSSLSNFSFNSGTATIRTTGNGTTAPAFNFYITHTVQPTITFNFWATKIA